MADSIRDALTQAFAKEPISDPAETTGDSDSSATSAPAEALEGSSSQTGAKVEGTSDKLEQTAGTPVAKASDQTPAPGSPPGQTPGSPAASADPAPASWKAEEKAAWAGLPPAAKAAIKRREADTQRALSTSSGARKLEERFQTALTPYQKMLDGKGVKDAMSEVVAPILEIRRILEEGTAEQKAHAAYNIIKQFGVDVNKLDEYLVNGPGQVAQPVQAPQSGIQDTPEWKYVQQVAAREQAAENARLDTMISEISSDPLFEELREDTAAVLKAFSERGTEISLKDAFNRAKLLRPDLSPVITQNSNSGDNTPARGADGKFVAANLEASRKAAKSVSGAPKSTPGEKKGGSVRDDLMAAFEAHA